MIVESIPAGTPARPLSAGAPGSSHLWLDFQIQAFRISVEEGGLPWRVSAMTQP